MKKKGLLISVFGATVVACASSALLSNGNIGSFAFASDDCEGFHYELVEPTFEKEGHREYWTCCKHGEIFLTEPATGHFTDQDDSKMIGGCGKDNAAYLPAFNTTDYKRTTVKSNNRMVETWTKSAEGASDYTYSRTFDFGCITLTDYSTSSNGVTTTYSPELFNKVFEDDLELTLNKTNLSLTLNVKKEGGYTFNNTLIDFPSYYRHTLTITGESLTINAPDGDKGDGLSISCGTNTSSTATANGLCTLVVNNDLSIIYPSTNITTGTKSGLKESRLTINENASLTIKGFGYGIWAAQTPINANGTLDIESNTLAISSSRSEPDYNRTINVGNGNDLFFGDTFVRTGGSTDTDTIKTSSVKNLKIAPTTGPHHDTHTWAEAWSSDASQHWHACTEPTCEEVSDKSAHTFDWVVTKDPTYEAKGTESYTCTVCGYVAQTRDIDQLVHSYSENWSYDDVEHWHECIDEGYEGKEHAHDIDSHSFAQADIVAPTYTTDGSKTRGVCSICGETIQDYVIPALNETDYTRTCTNGHSRTAGLTETWTLKNPSSIGEESYVVTKTFKSGWVTVNDMSSGTLVRTDYTPYSFNKTFDGIEMSFDETNKELVVNVTKEGGYTFNNASLNFPSDTGNTVKITGEPLIINAPEAPTSGTEYFGLSFEGSTGGTGNMCHAIIDTDVTVVYSDSYSRPSTTSGLRANFFDVNEGASFTTSGFKNGVTAQWTFTINGLFDVSGKELAMISSNSNSRTINYGKGTALYFDDVLQGYGAKSTTTTDIDNAKAKHVMVVAEDEPNPYKYTIMMYMSPSTIENNGGTVVGNASKSLKKICDSWQASDDVRFIIETGGVANSWSLSSSYLDGATSISTSKLQRWEVASGKLKLIETLDTNSSATQTNFQNFLKWGLEDYAADKMGVIMYGHGNAMRGCTPDGNSSSDQLTQAEVALASKNALAAYGRDKFTWIGYDCCIMAEADIATINSQYYDYMVCSQEVEPQGGWAYNMWLDDIYSNPEIDEETLLSSIVTSYNDMYRSITTYTTLSCLDLTKCGAFVTAFQDYAANINSYFTGTTSQNLTYFADTIKAAYGDSHKYNYQSYGSVTGIADFVDFLHKMETYFPLVSNEAVINAIEDMVILSDYNRNYFTDFDPCGLNVFVVANHIHGDAPSGTYYFQAAYSSYYATVANGGTLLTNWQSINKKYSSVNWVNYDA